jgi:DNA-binding Lrp family transcriptional regulator
LKVFLFYGKNEAPLWGSKMDELDKRLISQIQSDPRRSSARLAEDLGLTEYSIRKRINHLVSAGELIFTALPDLKRFGYTTSCYFGIKVNKPSKFQTIGEQLCSSPYLHFVAHCEGFTDFFVRGNFNSTDALANFVTKHLSNIDGISHVDIMVELKLIKRNFRILCQDANKTETSTKVDIVIDNTDRQLILELQKDCRAPLKKLAGIFNMGKTTVHRRIKHLVASKAIELTAIPDKVSLGYTEECFMGIDTELMELDNVASVIARYPQVGTVGIYSGPTQLIVAVFAASSDDLSNFVNQEISLIPGIRRVDWLIHMNILKRTFSWLQE